MAEYIDREKIISKTCSNCTRQIDLACQYEEPCEHLIAAFLNEDAADVAPVVRCKNCIYWKDRHIKLNDGTERPYTEEELHQFFGMVPISIGVNVGSYCTRIKLEDTYFWCGPDDFCSKGAQMDGTEVTDERSE